MTLSRRAVLKSLATATGVMVLAGSRSFGEPGAAITPPPVKPSRPLLGAIRWDAWHGKRGGPGKAIERSLGPAPYHWRLPFFAKVVSDHEVAIDGATPEIMDREIAFAHAAGLDYWAFLLYGENDPMSLSLKHYLASPRKGEIRFCAIATPNTFGAPKERDARLARLVRLAGEPSYQTVLGGRPLLYLGFIEEKWLQAWGGPAGSRRVIDGMRARYRAAGLGDPYLVIMDFDPQRGCRLQQMLGADAISAYATNAGAKGASYAALASHAAGFWERCKKTGAPVVPIAMAGWDRRPRIEHPVPWEPTQKPGEGMDRYYQSPTPAELAAHMRQALDWVEQNPQAAPARAVLTYAWNENDEGGWLVPALRADGSVDATRLEAIGRMLREWQPSR